MGIGPQSLSPWRSRVNRIDLISLKRAEAKTLARPMRPPQSLMSMPWVFLIIAGLFEVVWAIGLKFTMGFTRLGPSVITVSAMIASFLFLAQALKSIPVGTGYAVWTGIGAVGVAIIGMIWLGESREVLRILCIVLIVAGVLGLKLVTTS